MLFDYHQSIAVSDLPEAPAELVRATILARVAEGWRILALFGLPQSSGTSVCCILGHDSDAQLMALRTQPVSSYQSLTPQCPQAHLFERELYEQWRIVPEGHPWLKPVRFAPSMLAEISSQRPGPGEMRFHQVRGSQVHEVAVGPVHAGIIEPGHFRFQCHGENVMFLEISLGFQHRGIEKMLSNGPDIRTLHFMECAAGDSTVAHATAYASVVERMTGQVVTEQTHAARRIALELERLANHTGDLGALAGDTGFLPTSSWNGRIRGDFLNITALLCGNRFGRGLIVPGGMGVLLEPLRCAEALSRLEKAYHDVRGAVDVMFAASSVTARMTNTGRVSQQDARALGLVGCAARACGLEMDSRIQYPLSRDASSHIHVRTASSGDVLARALVRNMELDDAAAQVRGDLVFLRENPDTHQRALPALPALPASRLAVAQVEGWRGEVCHVAVTDKQGRFLVYKIVDPSFHNWSGLAMALRSEQISDFPLCNKSFNLSYCGHDL